MIFFTNNTACNTLYNNLYSVSLSAPPPRHVVNDAHYATLLRCLSRSFRAEGVLLALGITDNILPDQWHYQIFCL